MLDQIRVLHVTETAIGGVGAYLRNLLPMQSDVMGAGNLRVIAPSDEVEMLDGGVQPGQLVPFARNGRSLSGLAALTKTLDAQLRDFRPDIVHVHSTFAGMISRGPLVLKTRRSGVVYCPHGWSFLMDLSAPKRWLAQEIEHMLSGGADAIVAVSRSDQDAGLKVGIHPRKMRYVANGVPSQSPAPAAIPQWRGPADALKILFVGRFDRQKGIDVLREAVRPLGDRVTVMAVGRAVSGEPSPALADNMQIHDWMTPEGLEAWYASCDLVAIPSRWEGLPLVALEAMRAGKAIVASAVGGLPEAIEDGVTGVLIPEIEPALFQAALEDLDRPRLAAMGVKARERFEARFGMERVERELRDIYRDVLQARPVRRKSAA